MRQTAQSERNRRIKAALLTSVLARASGVLLQLASLPIAATSLGPDGFTTYAMLGALLAAMSLSTAGLAQSTTLHMARARAAGDLDTYRQIFATALAVAVSISFCVALATAATAHFFPTISELILEKDLSEQPSDSAVLIICIVFGATQTLALFEAAQLAQQRQARVNLAVSLGTLGAASAVWWVGTHSPSVQGILLALHSPLILARAANALAVARELHPLSMAMERSAITHCKTILRDGFQFASGATLANFLCHSFSVIVIGIYATPQTSASFAAVVNGLIIAASVFGLVITPFNGAIPEAHAHGDNAWIKSSVRKILLTNSIYGLSVCFALLMFGTEIFSVWYRGAVAPSTPILEGAAVYFFLLSLEVTFFAHLTNTGALKTATRWSLAKALGSATFLIAAAQTGNPDAGFWILCAFSLLFAVIPLGLHSVILLNRHPRVDQK